VHYESRSKFELGLSIQSFRLIHGHRTIASFYRICWMSRLFSRYLASPQLCLCHESAKCKQSEMPTPRKVGDRGAGEGASAACRGKGKSIKIWFNGSDKTRVYLNMRAWRLSKRNFQLTDTGKSECRTQILILCGHPDAKKQQRKY